MTEQRVIALLGRRDEPTDALQDYCRYLGEALSSLGIHLEFHRAHSNETGWKSSLASLKLQAKTWNNCWVLVQYTALAWSDRGFPLRFLRVLRLLRRAGAKPIVVFHDAEPFGGTRVIDRIRRTAQLRVMRQAVRLAKVSVFTVPPKHLSWVNPGSSKLHFIPVGANLPSSLTTQSHRSLHVSPTIAVYGITGGTAGDKETHDIIAAVGNASKRVGDLKLLVFGRHADLRERSLREGLSKFRVDINVCGVLKNKELVHRFAESDVLLFVRGSISSRRGSAIAGIACGLPVIALQGSETGAPITDAGVILIPEMLEATALHEELSAAIIRVVSDEQLRLELVHRSELAQREFFSWRAIAAEYAKILKPVQ
jgi:glycosyltransferase involved in cell wall biosynthesis